MKVVHVSFFYDEAIRTQEELLQRHYTTTGWAEALQQQQVEVTVINRFHQNSSFVRNNVRHVFFNDGFGGRFSGWHLPLQFLKQIRKLNADVIHLHHLTLSIQTFFLRIILPRRTAIVVQHHGGESPGRIKRFVHSLLNSVADGFFFTTVEQGKQWLINNKAKKKIMPVMEGGSFFEGIADHTSEGIPIRKSLAGEEVMTPVFLWVGRLDKNKDPLTILGAFELILDNYPQAVLYMAFGDGELIREVKERIAVSKQLHMHVRLLGRVEHKNMPSLYERADYFLLGSHHEGSGYALSEALRFGCVPVITRIPSFEMMTNHGDFGALWEVGNKQSLVNALKMILKKPLAEEAQKCTDFYHAHLTYNAIATMAAGYYQQLLKNRQRNKVEN